MQWFFFFCILFLFFFFFHLYMNASAYACVCVCCATSSTLMIIILFVRYIPFEKNVFLSSLSSFFFWFSFWAVRFFLYMYISVWSFPQLFVWITILAIYLVIWLFNMILSTFYNSLVGMGVFFISHSLFLFRVSFHFVKFSIRNENWINLHRYE